MLKNKPTNLVVSIFLALITLQLWGQNTGTLTGTVTDASGSAVPQANVTVKNDAGFSQSVITDSSGNFTVSNLPPGTYNVTVEVTGYGPLTRQGVQVAVGQPIRL